MNESKIRMGLIPVLFFYAMSLNGCKSTTNIPPAQTVESVQKEPAATVTLQKNAVFAIGIIQKQGVTTYQYGTHVLMDEVGKTLYALKSETLQLDNYLGRKLELQGNPVEDYPVDGGPPYLEVVKIKDN